MNGWRGRHYPRSLGQQTRKARSDQSSPPRCIFLFWDQEGWWALLKRGQAPESFQTQAPPDLCRRCPVLSWVWGSHSPCSCQAVTWRGPTSAELWASLGLETTVSSFLLSWALILSPVFTKLPLAPCCHGKQANPRGCHSKPWAPWLHLAISTVRTHANPSLPLGTPLPFPATPAWILATSSFWCLFATSPLGKLLFNLQSPVQKSPPLRSLLG